MHQEFVSLQAGDRLDQILKSFGENHVTSAPVFDGKEFVGIVSDVEIVKFFTPKKYFFLWKKDKPTPVAEIMKVSAAKLVRKPEFTLNADDQLSDVLDKISRRRECLPVFEKGTMVGLVRGRDIVNFFLKELAKSEYSASGKPGMEEKDEIDVNTDIEKVMEIINKRGEASCGKISKETGIPVKSVEKLCETLEKHRLIKLRYSFLGGVVARRLTHEKGR
ncbi:CBS domain protein [Candidatus Gugararchaeum adminiculabundum]|nr:CBS domain protein [Candidatus Gugararchaeum adminiculabundum]